MAGSFCFIEAGSLYITVTRTEEAQTVRPTGALETGAWPECICINSSVAGTETKQQNVVSCLWLSVDSLFWLLKCKSNIFMTHKSIFCVCWAGEMHAEHLGRHVVHPSVLDFRSGGMGWVKVVFHTFLLSFCSFPPVASFFYYKHGSLSFFSHRSGRALKITVFYMTYK